MVSRPSAVYHEHRWATFDGLNFHANIKSPVTRNVGRQSDRFGGWTGSAFEWLPSLPNAGLGWFTGARYSYSYQSLV